MAKLTRRDILRQLAGSGLMIALPTSALARPTDDLSPPLATRLSQFFSHRESAQVIGRQYLALRPEEANLDRLTTLIFRTPENYAQLENADSERIREFLSKQQRWDFEHLRTVNVNGWILSETEARLCAITAVATIQT